ncbi:hypothetical protein VTO42DRAFT_6253 [Malbranchea cinnamomea]
MANLLIEKRGNGNSEPIGPNWVTRFIKRHPEIKSKFARKFNYKRTLCENPKIIEGWFNLVRDVTDKYRILPEDVYNMDEVGFAMGMIPTCMVVTNSERKGRPKLVQPGNREWTTVIAAVNALGWALAPVVIFKGKNPPLYKDEVQLPPDWIVKSSPNGWTTDELGFFWVKEVFDKQTRHRTKGEYRLLIMDSHGSHVTPEFDSFCMENKIVLLYMPPHSSHLLQPLDMSCFSALKKAYGRLVENQIRCGINHVDKIDFLSLYLDAHACGFSEQNIQSGFRATGLIPFAPYEVLCQLPPATPSRPSTAHNSLSSWTPKTPRNTDDVRRQSARIQSRMHNRTTPLSSPIIRFMGRLFDQYEKVVAKVDLLEQENMEIRTANGKVQQRKRKSTYVPQRGAAGCVQTNNEDSQQEDEDSAQQVSETFVQSDSNNPMYLADGGFVQGTNGAPVRKRRAPNRCSVCRAHEHTARTCPHLN